MKRDNIYSQPQDKVKEFVFDRRVVEVFDDMISRSVPLYKETEQLTTALFAEHLPAGALIYDLGCSTGALSIPLAEQGMKVIAVDNSASMIERCQENAREKGVDSLIEFKEEDITTMEFMGCDGIVLNYTLQFVPSINRLELLTKLRSQLTENGMLVLSEKLACESETLNQLLRKLHHSFKFAQGYSTMEIAQKRNSLEQVLIPLSAYENQRMLTEAGFSRVESVARWLNFGSFVALP